MYGTCSAQSLRDPAPRPAYHPITYFLHRVAQGVVAEIA